MLVIFLGLLALISSSTATTVLRGYCYGNETFVNCKAGCPTDYCPTSDSRAIVACSPPNPCNSGCVCKLNYKLLSEKDHRCVLTTDCPPVTCTRPNEVWNPCAQCLAERCEDVNSTSELNCPAQLRSYCNPQCVCASGYYRNSDEICVPKQACPGLCPVPAKCRPTCSVPNPPNCPAYKPPTENEDGCQCQPGYILSEAEGKCVKIETCPNPCYANETLVYCKAGCPTDYCPTSDSRAMVACAPPYPCNPGCVCKPNYKLLNQDDKRCVLITDCPPVTCTRPNEVWNPCAQCLAERCEDVNSTSELNCPAQLRSYCRPQCVCASGYYRNNDDVCVPEKACPGQCPVPAKCRPTCSVPNPPNCPAYKPPTENEDGCQCRPGYILSETEGKCIRIETCPSRCYANETLVSCKAGCPTDYCPTSDSRAIVACALPYPCNPGCVCKPNHKLLSQDDKRCVLITDCPPVTCTRPNEVWNPCAQCLAERCEDVNSTSVLNCPAQVRSYCRPQCVCASGYYRNNDDVCVPEKACPGQCPVPAKCRPTCSVPNPPNCPAYKPPTENEDGCQCQPGYILSETEGKCVKIETCPSLCYANETLIYCKAGCPTDYCPTSDSRAIVACSPPYPCNPGCVCKPNYKLLSQDDKRCVLITDCPPVTCTRPNEVWNPCAQCLAERCEDVNSTSKLNCPVQLRSYCRPQCVCASGYYRNNAAVCVPEKACPGQCPVPAKCRPTCSVPNPPNCPVYKPPKENEDGCQCQPGYILSETEGKCVKIEECPKTSGCNGDMHAQVKKCPLPCPSTCKSPEAVGCKKMCDPVGCECEYGYILSEIGGKCIKPAECPGGDPCGLNGTFVKCKSRCPNDYCPVNDNLGVIICEGFPLIPCYSGCACKLNYKRHSQADQRCILSTDCPPVNCTRPNEVWSPSPPPCLRETCDVVDVRPMPCNELVASSPRCICKDNYFRNDSGICVCAQECRDINAKKRNCKKIT